MSKLGTCIQCGAEIEKRTWVSKFGFCIPQHYVDYMSEHRLWSSRDPNYSQEHMDKIEERIGRPIEAVMYGLFYGIEKLPWLDTFVKVEWALLVLDILYILFA